MHGASRLLWFSLGAAVAYLTWVGVGRFVNVGKDPQKKRPAGISSYPGAEGTAVKVLNFYSSSGEVTKGDQAVICYGVANARAVRLEPAVAELEPALNRCFSVAPERTTTFKLIAEGRNGANASAEFAIKVNPAPPRILFVTISSRELKRGEKFLMCYGVENATDVHITPGTKLQPSEKMCVMWFPVLTTKYTLTAASADGRTDKETFTVKVK